MNILYNNGVTRAELAGKADLVDGKVPESQLPDLAISDYLGAVNTEAAMLALVGQKGDWCSRTDLGTVFIITGSNPALIGSWTQLNYPGAPVTSVAGKTGTVTLVKGDVGLGSVDNTTDADKPVSTAQAAADAAVQAHAIARANHTGTQTAATISDFNSSTRAQTEAALVAGSNITITPGSSGASRTLTIASSGGGGGGGTEATQSEVLLGTSNTVFISPARAREQFLSRLDWDFYRNALVTNSGGANASLITNGTYAAAPSTGATAGAFFVFGCSNIGKTPSWNLPVLASLQISSVSVSTNSLLRVLVSGQGAALTTVGDFNRQGIGFDVRNLRLWFRCHTGSTLSEFDTGFNLGAGIGYEVVLSSSGSGNTTISLILTGAVPRTVAFTGTYSGGPTTHTGSGTANIIASNGGDASACRWTLAGPMRIAVPV